MLLAVTPAKAGVQSTKLDSGFPPPGTSGGMTKLQTSAGRINKLIAIALVWMGKRGVFRCFLY
jgi:Trk-type K+ transport system membrane component